jgi:L-threonylcarbamoyladenylate synthase
MELNSINMRLDLTRRKKELNEIANAVGIIKQGGLVIYPTETYYGIGADALNPDAVKRIFKLKGRTDKKPLPLIISDKKMLDLLGAEINEISSCLIDSFWPGPLTILFRVKNKLPDGVVSVDKKVAVRISSNPIAFKIADLLGGPITATSANLSGGPSPDNISDISDELIESVDAVIDFGKLPGSGGSTIVDATISPVRIIREGAIPSAKIFSVVRRHGYN